MRALALRTDRPTYLPDAVDDRATVSTVSELTTALRPFARKADRVDLVVASLVERLNEAESLTDRDRQAIAYLVLSIEESLG